MPVATVFEAADEADSALPAAVVLHRAEADNLQALSCHSDAEVSRAVALLDRAVRTHPMEPSYLLHRATRCHLRLGDLSGAVADLDVACRLVRPPAVFLHRLKALLELQFARACLTDGRYARAVGLLESALPHLTDPMPARLLLAATLVRLGRPDATLACLSDAHSPQNSDAYQVPLLVVRCRAKLATSRYVEAFADLQAAYKLAPAGTVEMKALSRHVVAVSNQLRRQAKKLVQSHALGEALHAVNNSLGLRPGNRDLIKDRALVHLALKDHAKCIADLEAVGVEDEAERQHLAACYLQYGTVLFGKRQLKAARQALEKSMQHVRTSEALRVHGLTCMALEAYDAAIQSLLQYLDTRPQDHEIRRKCIQLHLYSADAALKNEQLAVATRCYTAAIDMDSQCTAALYGRAKLYIRDNDLPKARADLHAVLRLDPSNASAQRFLDQISSDISEPIEGVVGFSFG